MAIVRVPTMLRSLVGGEATLEVEGSTVGEVLDALAERHPGVRERVFDDQGKIRRFVNIYVDDEDIRHIDGLDTRIGEGQAVSILPAVAGGRTR